MKHVTVISFGYLHGDPPPEAHLTVDLRTHFRDPHVSPELRELTARDAAVRMAVLATPGISELAMALIGAVRDGFLTGPAGEQPLVIAVGCAGGRHRAPVFADTLAALIPPYAVTDYVALTLIHRDLDKAVVER